MIRWLWNMNRYHTFVWSYWRHGTLNSGNSPLYEAEWWLLSYISNTILWRRLVKNTEVILYAFPPQVLVSLFSISTDINLQKKFRHFCYKHLLAVYKNTLPWNFKGKLRIGPERTHKLLVHADDADLLGENIHTIKKCTEALPDASKEVVWSKRREN